MLSIDIWMPKLMQHKCKWSICRPFLFECNYCRLHTFRHSKRNGLQTDRLWPLQSNASALRAVQKLACEPDSADDVCLISVCGHVYPHSNCCPRLGTMGMSLFAETVLWQHYIWPRAPSCSAWEDCFLPLQGLEYSEVQWCFCPYMEHYCSCVFCEEGGSAFIKCV